MKKIILSFLLVLLIVSCNTGMPYKGTGLVGNVIEKDYEVLGPVTVSGTIHNVLGLIQWGKFGYNDILKKAQELYPETDAVINITEDITSFSVALIYNKFGMEFNGLAIKYLDGPGEKISVNVELPEESPVEPSSMDDAV